MPVKLRHKEMLVLIFAEWQEVVGGGGGGVAGEIL